MGTDGTQADMNDGDVGERESNDLGVLRNLVIKEHSISGAAAEE